MIFLPRTICLILAFSLSEPAPRISTLKEQHYCQLPTLSQLEMLEKQVDTLILINSFDSKLNEVVLHSFTVTSPASSLAITRSRIQNILKNLSWFMTKCFPFCKCCPGALNMIFFSTNVSLKQLIRS